MLDALLLDGAASTAVTRLRADHRTRPTPEALWEQMRTHWLVYHPPNANACTAAVLARATPSTPPTHLRIALLTHTPPQPIAITVTPTESATITAELTPHRTAPVWPTPSSQADGPQGPRRLLGLRDPDPKAPVAGR
ncbi:hypothetical protein ACWCXH_34155 [Kitasatospora sp. NPDC001660]